MKKTLLLISFCIANVAMAQVGVGTTNPQADLDVRATNPASPDASAGIAIPQISSLPASGNRAGQVVYLTTENRYFYYSGSNWQPIYQQVNSYGDVKYSFQATDHDGWILLDGRAKSSLTTTQQAAATSLGFGETLPDLSDKSIVGTSATKSLGGTGGNSTISIAQNQLPDVTLTTSTNGAHTHTAGTSTTYLLSLVGMFGYQILNSSTNTTSTSSSGSHAHTTSSINGGVSQQALDIQNPYIAINGFVYLGR
jgi:hypothetical protein